MPGRFRVLLPLALVLLPVVGQFVVVATMGVNSPAADELLYLDFVRNVREGGDWVPMLWNQHNEHRVIPFKLALAAIAKLTPWNVRAEMYVSALLAGLLVLVCWISYRQTGGTSLWLFAPVPWLVCSLAQYENMLYGLQMCQYQTTLGFALAMLLLTRESNAALVGAVLAALMSSFSLLNGLLVWPIGLALLVVARSSPWRLMAWGATSTAGVAAYFWRYRMAQAVTAPWTLRRLSSAGRFFVSAIGSPLSAASAAWSYAVGIAVLVGAAAAVVFWRRGGWSAVRADAVASAFALFGLGSSAAIALGRAALGTEALQPRYITHTLFATLGVYLLALAASARGGAHASRWLAVTLGLIIPGLLAADLYGIRVMPLWRSARLHEAEIVRSYRYVSDEQLRLGGSPGLVPILRRALPYFESHRLGPFSEPLARLVEPNPAAWSMTPELLASTPVEQRLTCPVKTLNDLAIRVTRTADTPNPSTLSIALWAGERRLGARRLDSSLIGDGWIGVPLGAPLVACAGKALRVVVTTTDTIPGGGVVLGSSPRYYEGELVFPGWPAARDRCLELVINARDLGGY